MSLVGTQIVGTRTTETPPPASQPSSGVANNGPISYNNLPSSIAWTPYKAPVTGDNVYLGQMSSGQYVYVGPDNQPYVSTNKVGLVFSGGNHLTINPSQVTPRSWAQLGFSNANNTVNESQYQGPGADSVAVNLGNYSRLSGATGGTETFVPSSQSPFVGATAPTSPNPNPTVATSTPAATSDASALDSAASGLLSGGDGGGGVPGSGSIAGGLPVIPTTSTSSSGPSITALLVILGLVGAGVAVWWYSKHRKEKKAPDAATGAE